MCLLSISYHHVKFYYRMVRMLEWIRSIFVNREKFLISSSINCVSSNGTIKKQEYSQPSLIWPDRLSPEFFFVLKSFHMDFEFSIRNPNFFKAGQIWISKIFTKYPLPSLKSFIFLNSVAGRLLITVIFLFV